LIGLFFTEVNFLQLAHHKNILRTKHIHKLAFTAESSRWLNTGLGGAGLGRSTLGERAGTSRWCGGGFNEIQGLELNFHEITA
jgi:hypothetical protein